MTVARILKSKGNAVVSVAADDPVGKAVSLLTEHRIGAVLVLDAAGRIVGILSERDIIRGANTYQDALSSRKVSELMTREVATCTPETRIAEVMGMMTARRFRHVPVLDGDRIAGIVSIGDVVKSRIEEAEAEVDALRRYIAL